MKPKRFTEEQMIAVLKESETGAKTEEMCRRHGINSAMFYSCCQRYGGVNASEAKRLRELKVEYPKLKRLEADQVFGRAVYEGTFWQGIGSARGQAQSRGGL